MNDARLEEALHYLAEGSAICFLGAGFSTEAFDASGKSLPSADELAEEIFKLTGLEEREGASLSVLAGFCEGNDNLAPKLRKHLVERLTLTKPSDDQRRILSAPWKSFFTTNFDDIIERTLGKENLAVATPRSDTESLRREKQRLYYLHGRAQDIVDGHADPGIVLSENNYLNLKAENHGLYNTLLNEITMAERIFFIGYSIRDMELASRLFSIQDSLTEKAIVCCHESEGPLARDRLKSFGHVVATNFGELAQNIEDAITAYQQTDEADYSAYVQRFSGVETAPVVAEAHVDHLFLNGLFDHSAYARQLQGQPDSDMYCVRRSSVFKKLYKNTAHGVNRFVVTSDIVNGKTIFLEQLKYEARAEGYEVLVPSQDLPETRRALERILTRRAKHMIILDDLDRNKRLAQFIGEHLSGLDVLVVADRISLDRNGYLELSTTLSGTFIELDLNEFNEDELRQWDNLLEQFGLWGERISLPYDDRIKFLKKTCGSENRAIVLSLFRESRLAERIKAIVHFFLRNDPARQRAFVAILIGSLCHRYVQWSNLVQWLKIDEGKLRREIMNEASEIRDLVESDHRWYRLTSNQLAAHILVTYQFDQEIIVQTYVTIVRETAESAKDRRYGGESRDNLKQLMKFRFLTQLFASHDNPGSFIETIYSRLRNIASIRNNDQFWLQYAMSKMDNDDLLPAEKYLSTARGIAGKKGDDYNTEQIDDQFCRLILRKNAQAGAKIIETELNEAIDYLNAALGPQTVLIYPLRSVALIEDLLESRVDDLSVEIRSRFKNFLLAIQEKLPTGRMPNTRRGEKEMLTKKLRQSIIILQNT